MTFLMFNIDGCLIFLPLYLARVMLAYFYLRLMLPDKKLIGESKVMIYLG